MSKRIFITTLLSFFLLTTALQAQVVINEYSCSNLSQYVDNHSDYGDWFELYNTGNSTVNLSGYYLSDDSISNLKWQIPAGISINAHGFLKFWASGRDEVSGSSYHVSFKLTQTKNNPEYIVLSNPSGNIINYIKLTRKTQLGHSLGRTLDGASAWSLFVTPTPGATNNGPVPFDHYADRPDFSVNAGFYTSAQTVIITTNEPNADIHYTLDGTLPTSASPIYSGPINISSTTVLKAITLSGDPEVLPSFIRYETYFINVTHSVKVISVSGNSLTQLANGSGSLVPHGTFEYFDISGTRTANTYGEFNRHGQDSWALSHRSIDFISRDEMGYNHSVEEKIFARSDRQNYQRLILRAAGDDNYPADHRPANEGSAHLRDAYVQSLSEIGMMKLDIRRSEKCVVYLNGEYWGVYDLREKCDDHDYIDYYYNQDKYHIQYIMHWGGTWAEYGGQQAIDDWDDLYSYINTNSMTVPANLQYVSDRFDYTSLIDYVLANSMTVCSDWLNWNLAWWRGMDSTGGHKKWGFNLWDNDATFGHYINYTQIPNTTPTAAPCNPEGLTQTDPKKMIVVLNKLRQNPIVEQYYVARQADLYNTVYSCENMISQLDSTKAIIDPEMTMQADRWNGTYQEWQDNYDQLKDFIQARCAYIPGGIADCYNLTGPYNLTIKIDPPASGFIKINSLDLASLPWSGIYFGNMKTLLHARPHWNYVFSHWSSGSQNFLPQDTCRSVNFTLNGNDTVTAHFTFTAGIAPTQEQKPAVQLYPTVFREYATLAYTLPAAMPVDIKLISPLGAVVEHIVKPGQSQAPGGHSLLINLSGKNLAPGTYFLDFRAGNFRKGIKLIYSPR